MRVSIIGGTGYIGLVTGIGLAAKGHRVICADIDRLKIENIERGVLPICEEGLDALLQEAKRYGNISFTSSIHSAVIISDIVMIAVGTPEGINGETDMNQLLNALKSVAAAMDHHKTIVIKSTVPVGTNDMAATLIKKHLKSSSITFDMVSNPEFLREGSAVKDFMNPDRIVIGTCCNDAAQTMRELYRCFDCPVIVTEPRSSEMIKYACNSYLAARISFINEIAEICEKVDANIQSVIDGMKSDKRIGGHYLSPGPGFGGPCLHKDIRSLIHFGEQAGADVGMLKAVLERNEKQIESIVQYIGTILKSIKNKKVAVLGLSFKAGTSDTRNSPAITLIRKLVETNCKVSIYDPVICKIEEHLNSSVIMAQSIGEATVNADCIVVMTEWEEFFTMNLDVLYNGMRHAFIVDARNIISPDRALKAGFQYKGIGVQRSGAHLNGDHLMKRII
jgi:UDPglucose 6-dehydrogenase